MRSFHHITFCCQTCCGEEYSTVCKIKDRIIQISFLADKSSDQAFNTNSAASLGESASFHRGWSWRVPFLIGLCCQICEASSLLQASLCKEKVKKGQPKFVAALLQACKPRDWQLILMGCLVRVMTRLQQPDCCWEGWGKDLCMPGNVLRCCIEEI